MAGIQQNDMERVIEKVRNGEMTADEANVEKVRIGRVMLVRSRLPAQVRAALNAAVKSGYLGHIKKDGLKPEAYYHPTFSYLVAGERNAAERDAINALKGVFA